MLSCNNCNSGRKFKRERNGISSKDIEKEREQEKTKLINYYVTANLGIYVKYLSFAEYKIYLVYMIISLLCQVSTN